MNPTSGNAFADGVRKAATDAAMSAFAAFGTAAVRALGEMMGPASAGGFAASGGDALAQTMMTALATDLRGRIVGDVDADRLAGMQVATHLAAFAAGDTVTPVDDVSVEHAFDVALGAFGALEGSATIKLTAACAYDAQSDGPKTATGTKITLAAAWSSKGKPAQPGP